MLDLLSQTANDDMKLHCCNYPCASAAHTCLAAFRQNGNIALVLVWFRVFKMFPHFFRSPNLHHSGESLSPPGAGQIDSLVVAMRSPYENTSFHVNTRQAVQYS